MKDAAQPAPDANISFGDLAESVQFRNMSGIVAQLTGMHLALTDPELRRSATLFGAEHDLPLCRLIHTTAAGRNACRASTLKCARLAAKTHNSALHTCHAGMHDMIVPIYVEGRHIANFTCGQTLPEPPSEAGWRKYRQTCNHPGLSPAELKSAYMATPALDPDRLAALSKLVSLMAEYFREVGARLRQTRASAISKVTLARQYMETNFREQIRIAQVAGHVNMSPTYLSALFRKHAGRTMVGYLEQMRIDEARKLLGKPGKNISEIAYEVGFNNLTHFNRVFRKIAGCPPSEYRARIAHLRDACMT